MLVPTTKYVTVQSPELPQFCCKNAQQPFSFAALLKPAKPRVISEITDRNSFSSKIYNRDNTPDLRRSLTIKAPNTDFIIPKELQQFIPMIVKCYVDHQNQGHQTPMDHCQIEIIQSTKIMQGASVHIDGRYDRIIAGTATNTHMYIAYDAAPTHFYQHAFHIDATSPRQMRAQFQEQAQQLECIQFPQYSVVYFDSSAAHQGKAALNMGLRTVCIIRFRSDDIKPKEYNNDGLERIVEAQSTSSSTPLIAPASASLRH